MLTKVSALLACAAGALATTSSVTPHDMYSSSVGVLGCKINTDRVAYFPDSVGCDNWCIKVTYKGRSVNLLRIDQSGGAHDISYDAWVYLQTGKSATEQPLQGGGINMDWQTVSTSECASLIHTPNGGLPLSGANSMNYVGSCLGANSNWKYQLYNILNPTCTWGYDETCNLNLAVSNQASCPHQLGVPAVLTSAPVYNIQYGTGKKVLAT